MSPAGCPHVNSFKVDNWKQNLRVIYQCFVWSGSADTRKRKVTSDRDKCVFVCVCTCVCDLVYVCAWGTHFPALPKQHNIRYTLCQAAVFTLTSSILYPRFSRLLKKPLELGLNP